MIEKGRDVLTKDWRRLFSKDLEHKTGRSASVNLTTTFKPAEGEFNELENSLDSEILARTNKMTEGLGGSTRNINIRMLSIVLEECGEVLAKLGQLLGSILKGKVNYGILQGKQRSEENEAYQ